MRGFPEACRAWTILVAALIDRLRSAPNHIENKFKEITLEPLLLSQDICRRSSSRSRSSFSSSIKNASSSSVLPNLSTQNKCLTSTLLNQNVINTNQKSLIQKNDKFKLKNIFTKLKKT